MLLRAGLAALLLATVVRLLLPSEKADEIADARAAVVGALATQGIAMHEFSPAPREDIPVPVLFSAPGCDRLLQVLTVSFSFEESPLLETVIEPGFRRHYIYFGRIWLAPAPLAIRLEWLKQKAIAILWRQRSMLPKWVLLVAEPPSCHVIERIDWRRVWAPQTASGSKATDVAASAAGQSSR
jgi:hypothetical protein